MEYLSWLFGGFFFIILMVLNWVIGLSLLVSLGQRGIPISGKLWILVCIPFAFPIFTGGVILWFLGQTLWASLTGGTVEEMFSEMAEYRIANAYGYDIRPKWMEERNDSVLEMLRELWKENDNA